MSLRPPSFMLPCRRATLSAAVFALTASVLAAQPKDAPSPSKQESEPGGNSLSAAGREARDAGRFDEARRLFAKGESGATDPSVISRLRFDTALTYQLEGEARGNDLQSLEKAAVLYEQVLADRKDSAATLSNLARTYARLGKWDLAEDRYRRAARLEGPDQPFYLKKYADYLAERGDWASAGAFYETVALARPQSTEVHEILLARYRQVQVTGDDPLSVYLWKLVEAGEGPRAADAALDVLASRSDVLDLKAGSILMSVVAAGIGRSPLDPEAFLASPTAKALRSLAGRMDIGQASRELLDLVRASGQPDTAEKVAARVTWWRSVPPWAEQGAPPHGLWPADAIRSLVLSLGGWYESRGATALAEAHYRAAVILVPGDTDPGATRQLIQLFISQNQLGRVWSLLAQYQDRLFEGKGRAYGRADLAKIYEFHTTLGTLFGFLASKGQRYWGTSDDQWSAIFQLERAVKVGRELDAQPTSSGKAPSLHLDPNVVEYLARGYEASGELTRSAQVRVEAAVRFQAAGDVHDAQTVLKPVKLEMLPETDRIKIQEIRLQKQQILEPDELNLEIKGQKLQLTKPGNLKLDAESMRKLKTEADTVATSPPRR